jgi:glycosyltransferase involved in cell wall biosynthesis
MNVSIIVPTRNRSAVLIRCLAELSAGASGVRAPEVVVVDDCSTDQTEAVVEEFRSTSEFPVRFVRQERSMGANAARNLGLRTATGDVIVLIDDDVLVPPGWLSWLLSGLSADVPVVSGPVRLMTEGPVLGKHRHEVQSLFGEIPAAPIGINGLPLPVLGNVAVRREVFERARFDETLRPPIEEADWLRRAGVRAGFVPQAWVWHYKTQEELNPRRAVLGMWRRGSEDGWWRRERLHLPARDRCTVALRSLQTSLRAFGHAVSKACWGGAIIGIGELSRALAVAGLINRGPRNPQSWR